MISLTPEERARYQRQIMIPEIGPEGQERIKNASVFILGLGGLGSISAYYLTAAGIGLLRIVDRDRVELGNLNRQIIHNMDDMEKLKSDSACEKLRRLNPGCHIQALAEEVTEENAEELAGSCSVIIAGTDNMESRRALNRVSVQKEIPFILGGVDGFNGMVSAFVPPETACLECIFPPWKDQRETSRSYRGFARYDCIYPGDGGFEIYSGNGWTSKEQIAPDPGIGYEHQDCKYEKNLNCKVCSTAIGDSSGSK